jgi:membrane protease subunit HflC
MRTRFRLTLLAFASAALLVGACCSWLIVDETQFVLVTEFGRPVVTYGSSPGQSGLHVKWPWQTARNVDRRLQLSEPPPREIITGDKRNLDVAALVVWRVLEPERFVRSTGTLDGAGARLEERVSAALSNAIGRRPLASLASTDRTVWQLDRLTGEVLADVSVPARTDLGVEVVDVRLRRFNHPLEVRPAVFDLIRSERKRVAATLRAEGEARYQELTSDADRKRDGVLAQADAEAERIRGQAEAEATRLLNAAHARDPKFYEFLKTLETYRSLLDDKSVLVLSAGSPLLRLLTQGPPAELSKPSRPPDAPADSAESAPGRILGAPERSQ